MGWRDTGRDNLGRFRGGNDALVLVVAFYGWAFAGGIDPRLGACLLRRRVYDLVVLLGQERRHGAGRP